MSKEYIIKCDDNPMLRDMIFIATEYKDGLYWGNIKNKPTHRKYWFRPNELQEVK